MSASDSRHSKQALYLEQIDIEPAIKTDLHFTLQKDNNKVEIQRMEATSSWILTPSLEIFSASQIMVNRQSKFLLFKRSRVLAEVNGEDFMQAFWGSKQSLSCPAILNQQSCTVTFRFRPSHSSETIRTAVNRLQTAMQDYKRLPIRPTSQHIGIIADVGVALTHMNPFAKLAFDLAKTAFDVLKEQRKYDESLSDLAGGIATLLPFADHALQGVLSEDDLLDGIVKRLYDLIGETANFVVCYAQRGPTMKLLRPMVSSKDHDKIRALQRDFGKLKEDFDRAVEMEALIQARRIEELRFLKALKPEAGANYQPSQICMEGTRTTTLTQIMAWATRPIDGETQSSANVFWLYGMPGLGKTSVANSLCVLLRSSGNLGATFICKHDSLRQPEAVLPTLISKLARMWGPFRTVVAQVLHNEPQIVPRSTDGELLLKSLRMLKKHPPCPLVLVIDGLDECGRPNTRAPLLKCLMEACSLVCWLRVIVTSRPECDIEAFFDRHQVTRRDLATDDLEGKGIRIFTKSRMTSVATYRHLTPDWPGEERLDRIVEHSRGLFIFVDTLSRLVDIPEPDPLLNGLLDGTVEESNAELHKLYSKAITSRPVQHTKAFHSILRAVIAVSAFRPLCADTLAELIELDPSTVLSWVDELSSLLYKDPSMNKGIRVRNLSILEFLVGSSCPLEFRVDLRLANSELAHCCVAMMARQLKFNICMLETSYLPNADIHDLDDRVEKRIPAPLQYSCLYWCDHLCFETNLDSSGIELLEEFFSEARPLYWLEVLSLMGKVPVAILGLRLIKECLKESKHNRYRLMVEDLLAFVLGFFTPISMSASHIYISALALTPTESIIWKNASVHFPEILNVSKGRTGSWPALSGKLDGHSDWVRSVAYSPDGRNIVSGSSDGTIRIWNAQTGAPDREPWTGHEGPVWSVAYSPDGCHVISGSEDQTIRIWDAQTGVAIGMPLTGHAGPIWSVAYSPDGSSIVSGSRDKTIRIWNAKTRAVVKKLEGHESSICTVAYSPDGRSVVSGSDDKTIRIWDSQTGVALGKPLTGHAGWVWSVAYSPDGTRIVSGSSDETIRIWDVQTRTMVVEPLTGHSRTVGCVCYSSDGTRLISGSDDNTIRIWDAETGEAVGEPLTGHAHYVRTVAYSPKSNHFVSGSSDGTIRVWAMETRAVVGEPLPGHAQYVRTVAYRPDGRYVAAGAPDNKIQIWDVERGEAVGAALAGHTGPVWSIAYSPDGRNIATGSGDMTVRIWNAQTGKAIGRPLEGHTGAVWSVAYSPDGRRVVSGSRDNTIRIWNSRTGKIISILVGHTSNVCGVAWSPDGRTIASCAEDKSVRIWNAQTGVLVGQPLEGHEDWVWNIAYSPDSRNLASCSTDGTIRIWDVETGTAVGKPLIGHSRTVGTVAYSPDGTRIASGSDDNTIRIWDARTGEAVGEPLRGHTHYVRGVAYSPDGTHVVSGSSDNSIRIWDAKTCREKDSHSFVSHPKRLRGTDLSEEFSDRPIPTTLISPDGWVRGADGLLFWIPEDYYAGLVCPAITAIPNTGRQRCVRIDFTRFRYGTSWASIRGTDQPQSSKAVASTLSSRSGSPPYTPSKADWLTPGSASRSPIFFLLFMFVVWLDIFRDIAFGRE